MAKKTTTQDDEAAVLEKIATWDDPYKTMGERLHRLITEAVPELQARLWYGMPGYAKGKSKPVLCFFRVDAYMTFGLTEKVDFRLEDDARNGLMASAWFFTELDEATENRIAEIVRNTIA